MQFWVPTLTGPGSQSLWPAHPPIGTCARIHSTMVTPPYPRGTNTLCSQPRPTRPNNLHKHGRQHATPQHSPWTPPRHSTPGIPPPSSTPGFGLIATPTTSKWPGTWSAEVVSVTPDQNTDFIAQSKRRAGKKTYVQFHQHISDWKRLRGGGSGVKN